MAVVESALFMRFRCGCEGHSHDNHTLIRDLASLEGRPAQALVESREHGHECKGGDPLESQALQTKQRTDRAP